MRQFRNDIEAMEACDTCVLVLPCGRSAHTEAGWFAGRGKKTMVSTNRPMVSTNRPVVYKEGVKNGTITVSENRIETDKTFDL